MIIFFLISLIIGGCANSKEQQFLNIPTYPDYIELKKKLVIIPSPEATDYYGAIIELPKGTKIYYQKD